MYLYYIICIDFTMSLNINSFKCYAVCMLVQSNHRKIYKIKRWLYKQLYNNNSQINLLNHWSKMKTYLNNLSCRLIVLNRYLTLFIWTTQNTEFIHRKAVFFQSCILKQTLSWPHLSFSSQRKLIPHRIW